MSNLLVLAGGCLCLVLASWWRPAPQTVAIDLTASRPWTTSALDEVIQARASSAGEALSLIHSEDTKLLSCLSSARVRLVPDHPVTPRDRRLSSDVQFLVSPLAEGVALSAPTAGYLSRLATLSSDPDRPVRGQRPSHDFAPLRRLSPTGIEPLTLGPHDLCEKPKIDLRWIVPPEVSVFRDTAVVEVAMLIGPDTFDVEIISERPLHKGYGKATEDGLRLGTHFPLRVNGIPRRSLVEMTVHVCRECEQFNLVVQSIQLAHWPR